jgi:hypothetical protein
VTGDWRDFGEGSAKFSAGKKRKICTGPHFLTDSLQAAREKSTSGRTLRRPKKPEVRSLSRVDRVDLNALRRPKRSAMWNDAAGN